MGEALMLKQIASYYNTNATFHSFVQGMAAAIVAALASWPGGMPTTKMGLWALGAFVGKALFAWFTRWAQTRDDVAKVTAPSKSN